MKTAGQEFAAYYTRGVVEHFSRVGLTETIGEQVFFTCIAESTLRDYLELAFVAGQRAESERLRGARELIRTAGE